MNRLNIYTFVTFFFFSTVAVNAAENNKLPRVSPIPGGIVLVKTISSDLPKPDSYFFGNKVALVSSKGYWVAVVGLSLDTSPGPHVLYTVSDNGEQNSFNFNVKKFKYPRQNIRIKNKRQVIPTADDLVRIEKENKLVRKAFSSWTQPKEHNFILSLPVRGRFSSKFGLRRFINNEPRKPHSGIDIAAPLGKKLRAPADGIVILTGDYFFNGNTVFIDHGYGLVGMYNHLDKILVTDGQKLKRGQVFGTIGKSGRVTGPHLHWSVSLNNARINPLLLLDKKSRKQLGVK